MVAMIFLLAACLLVGGAGIQLYALNFLPTEFGFTMLMGGFVFVATGAGILALGFATRALSKRIAELTPLMAVSPIGAPSASTADRLGSAVGGQQEPTPPAPSMTGPVNAPLVGTALAVGAATATIAGASLTHAMAPEQPNNDLAEAQPDTAPLPDDKLLEDLERDLFAKPGHPSGAVDDARFETPGFEEAGDEDFTGQPRMDPLPVEAGRDDAVFAEETPGPFSQTPRNPDPQMVVERPIDPPPPAISGLIPDADLDALKAELTPLAPLDSLDVVGSYDSGGTRFTMYSDGSVHTAGPEGEKRYRSLDELRKHIDRGLKS